MRQANQVAPGHEKHVPNASTSVAATIGAGAELFLGKFCDAPDTLRAVFLRLPSRLVQLRDGEILCKEGDAGDQLWLVQRGQVRIESDTLLALRNVGDVVGEQAFYRSMCANGPSVRGATMRAQGDTRLAVIDHTYIAKMMPDEQVVWHRTLARVLSAKLDEATRGRTELRRDAKAADHLIRRFVCAEGLSAALAALDTGKVDPEQTDAILWFSDIAGFSKYAAGLGLTEIGALVRELMDIQVGSIEAADGQVDKLMGDGLMAFWLAPDERRKRQAAHGAIQAAITSSEKMGTLFRSRGLPLDIRIGLHLGPAILGDFGGTNRIAFTAIGETVNTASRYEQASKRVDGQSLGRVRVSPALWAVVDDPGVRANFGEEGVFTDKHAVEYPVRSLKR